MRTNSYIEGLQYPIQHPFRQESERLLTKFDTDTYKQDGVLRWKSNNAVPPQDVLDFWKFAGKRFNMQKSVSARKREEKEFLRQYRQNQRPPSPEQLNEMRGAFGPGETVVNILTGERIRL